MFISDRDNKSYVSSEDIEEYVMLLAYLTQSYIVTHTTALNCYYNDHTLSECDDAQALSEEDRILLGDLGFHVSDLCSRLEGFSGVDTSLSLRTNTLLVMMKFFAEELE